MNYCETCGEELDIDCQGRERCPMCDGPCPDCCDGPYPFDWECKPVGDDDNGERLDTEVSC